MSCHLVGPSRCVEGIINTREQPGDQNTRARGSDQMWWLLQRFSKDKREGGGSMTLVGSGSSRLLFGSAVPHGGIISVCMRLRQRAHCARGLVLRLVWFPSHSVACEIVSDCLSHVPNSSAHQQLSPQARIVVSTPTFDIETLCPVVCSPRGTATDVQQSPLLQL